MISTCMVIKLFLILNSPCIFATLRLGPFGIYDDGVSIASTKIFSTTITPSSVVCNCPTPPPLSSWEYFKYNIAPILSLLYFIGSSIYFAAKIWNYIKSRCRNLRRGRQTTVRELQPISTLTRVKVSQPNLSYCAAV